jgi:23S rRNA (adenine-N6)-dimethyltransferase
MGRADVIVERGAALKRSRPRGNLLNLSWGPWWKFSMGRVIPAHSFAPRPSVDAAVLRIDKRKEPLLPGSERSDYLAFVRASFASSSIRSAWRRSLSPAHIASLVRELGISPDAAPAELSLAQWIALYRGVLKEPAIRRGNARRDQLL